MPPVTPGAQPTELNLNATTPAAPAGYTNVVWQNDAAYPDPNNPGRVVRDASGHVPSIPNFADDETPSGSGTAWMLAHSPSPVGSLILIVDGQVLTAGATEDFTLSGAAITLATAPRAGANIRAWYRY